MSDAAPTLQARLRALAAFVPLFEDPDASFGEWSAPSRNGGVLALPYYVLSPLGESFQDACGRMGWIVPGFDWPTWSATRDAADLWRDESRLDRASADDLAHLLTMVIRRNRFAEGFYAEAFESGLLLRIARRAAALEAEDSGAR